MSKLVEFPEYCAYCMKDANGFIIEKSGKKALLGICDQCYYMYFWSTESFSKSKLIIYGSKEHFMFLKKMST